jgi:hypothetical protein
VASPCFLFSFCLRITRRTSSNSSLHSSWPIGVFLHLSSTAPTLAIPTIRSCTSCSVSIDIAMIMCSQSLCPPHRLLHLNRWARSFGSHSMCARTRFLMPKAVTISAASLMILVLFNPFYLPRSLKPLLGCHALIL